MILCSILVCILNTYLSLFLHGRLIFVYSFLEVFPVVIFHHMADVEDKIAVGGVYARVDAVLHSLVLSAVLEARGVAHVRTSGKLDSVAEQTLRERGETLHGPLAAAIDVGSEGA